ncbi:MAG: alkaline phosphatase [Clostridia bacterium]|nr:alkaline phosphatase [Clostridia bacterium]
MALLEKKGKKEGFFLMVEGGRIDHVAHANDPAGTIGDTFAFDNAVKVALDYAKKDKDTLVVVVADHETGGLTIGAGGEDVKADITLLSRLTKTAEFMGKQIKADGSNIDAVFAQYAGINDLSAAERTGIQSASKKALAVANVISARAGIKFASTGHTGVTVPVMAVGDKEHEFTGLLDNTEIPKIIAEAMDLDLN